MRSLFFHIDASKIRCQSIKTTVLAIFVSMFAGCTDLTETPYTFIDPGSYYKTEEQLNTALTGVYAGFRSFASNWALIYQLEIMTEHYSPGHTKQNSKALNAWQNVNQSTTYNFQIWDSGYDVINRANVILGRGEGIDMAEQARAQIYAQVRFMRAYTMFTMLRIYGGLAIPESYTSGLDGLEIPRKTADETYDYIIQDLEYCIANLPTRSQWGSSAYYKASKGAAQALLGDVYLTRGCMNNNNTSDFQQAKKYLGEVIDSHEYELLPDYKDLWYWYVEEAAKNTKESLFECQFGTNANNELHLYFGVMDTQKSLGSKQYHRASVSHQAYFSYLPEDTRLSCMLTEYLTDAGEKRYWVPENHGFYGGVTGGWLTSGPGNVKFYDRTEAAYTSGCAKANFILIRYSDVLLNYAEVENYLNGPTSDAYEKLNEVHQRSLPTPVTSGLSKEAFDKAVYQERSWELLGEGQLYFDELRTNRLGKNVYEHVRKYFDLGYYLYDKLQFVPQQSFLWKIPQTSLDSNPALEQNPDNIYDPNYPI